MSGYLDTYTTPIGILTVVYTFVWAGLGMYQIFLLDRDFGPAMLMTGGLVYALLVTLVLSSYLQVKNDG